VRNLELALAFFLFFAVVFSTFFFWTRLARRSSDGLSASNDGWYQGFVGSVLACLLFAVCFAIGVWFSISRLKGGGWILSA